MGVRMNKRVKLLPYVTMNVGKNGVSFTIGPKGKTLNVGKTGVTANVSMAQGVGYTKRIVTWKKLGSLLPASAIRRPSGRGQAETKSSSDVENGRELEDGSQQGCSWGCLLGAVAAVIIVVLAAAVAYLLITRGTTLPSVG